MKNKLFNLAAMLMLISPMAQASEVCGQIWKINTCGINGCPVFTFTTGEGANAQKYPVGAQSQAAWRLIQRYANSEREVCIEATQRPDGALVLSSLRAQ